MGENYIHINDIASFDMDNGRRETSAEYQICILGMNRKSVVGIPSKLLEHMEISPLEDPFVPRQPQQQRRQKHGLQDRAGSFGVY